MTEGRLVSRAEQSPVLAGPVPQMAPLPFLRYIRAVRHNALAGLHKEVFHQWVIEIRHPRIHTFIVNHPEAIRHVLLDNAENYKKGGIEPRIAPTGVSKGFQKSDAEALQQRRRSMHAALDFRAILEDSSAIEDATRAVLDRWNAYPQGKVIDIPAEMAAMTGQIVSRIVFSSDGYRFDAIMERLFGRYEGQTNLSPFDFVPLLDLQWRWFKLWAQRNRLRPLIESIDGLIASRTGAAADPGDDFLGRLLRERGPKPGNEFDAGEIHGQVLTVLGSGHDTVALALMWIWYLLFEHPMAEARLHAELDRSLAGRAPRFSDLAKLPYTRMVVEEALRLYPPIHTLAWRGALADDEIQGVKIPRGATVSIVPWVLHRHAELWEDGERFDPERFSPERSRDRHRFSYLPFGAGSRACIASSFAVTELILILATLAQHYRLRVVPGQRIEPQGLIALRARYGLMATLERRG
jgi:cytochrome P450